MTKNENSNNILIKKKLNKLLKDEGITRNNKEAINEIQKETNAYLKKIFELASKELKILGHKTLRQENIKNAIQKLKKQEDDLEI